jgi:hypothetical protein
MSLMKRISKAMQYVQSLPPVYTPTSPTGTVMESEAVKAVSPVTPQASPEVPLQSLDTPVPELEQRRVPRPMTVETERRKVCRRIQREPVLEELRSGIDRRRRNQRRDDVTTAIDEKI